MFNLVINVDVEVFKYELKLLPVELNLNFRIHKLLLNWI